MTEADIINRERSRAEADISRKLKALGVKFSVEHYSGDSSYPTEYMLEYRGIKGAGPTFEMALVEWITELVKICANPAEAYERMEAVMRLFAGNISLLMTDVSIIKTMVVDKTEE